MATATVAAPKITATTDISTISAADFGKLTVAELGSINKVQAAGLSGAQIGALTDKTANVKMLSKIFFMKFDLY